MLRHRYPRTGESFPNGVIFRWRRAWCADVDVLHLGMYPIDISFVGVIDLFLSGLADFILYLQLRRL